MTLKLGFAICYILATYTQASNDASVGTKSESPYMINNSFKSKDNPKEVNMCISNCVSCTYNASEKVVSDDALYQLTVAYHDATKIVLTGNDRSARVLIKNRKYPDECLDIPEFDESLSRVIRHPCKLRGHNQLVWLKKIASGHVSIVFSPDLCIGSGFDVGSRVRAMLGDEWCKDSPSHRFAMTLTKDGKYVQFRQAANELCLTSPDIGDDVYVDHCDEDNPRQHWQICDQMIKKCYPAATS